MYRLIILYLMFFSCGLKINAQGSNTYTLNWKKEAGIFVSTGLFWGGSKFFQSQIKAPTALEITSLNRANVNAFDRRAINNYSKNAARHSNYLLYSAFALPFTPLALKEGRSNALCITIMALETFFISDGLTNYAKAGVKRFRPFNYNPNVAIETKTEIASNMSFFSGHTSNVAWVSFFTAKVITDLHPELKAKWALWTGAAILPAATGYLRYRAGKHFPTDIISGYVVGALTGVLVPHFHKTKPRKIKPTSPIN